MGPVGIGAVASFLTSKAAGVAADERRKGIVCCFWSEDDTIAVVAWRRARRGERRAPNEPSSKLVDFGSPDSSVWW